MTLAVLSPALLATAPPAAAEGWSGCSYLCVAPGTQAGSGWQIEVAPNGTSIFAHPGMFVIPNDRNGFTLFWFGFFARLARTFCQSSGGGGEGPVPESTQILGPGAGSTTVNEGGGEGGGQSPGQAWWCEVVAE